MSSQAQALAPLPGVRGLVFLGFPLHPAGKPGSERAAHLQAVQLPMLFVQGTEDALAERSILLRDRFLPLFKVTELLRLPEPRAQRRADLPIVLCEWSGQRMGIEVHRILRRGEMLIRETHPRIAALPGIGGISTMGFDRIVLVLDPDEIFELARKASVFGLRVPDQRLAFEQAREQQG